MSALPDNDVAKQILKHLVENPEGMDTLEGIARFWVLRQKIQLNIQEVESAVFILAEEGLLLVREPRNAPGSGDGPLYCLNSSRLSEIKAIVSNNAHQ